ncbi:MAG TPA: hypothetical protein DCP91_02465 [Eggerthellaceae bacterium]|nr:hypothetical protein [Eggerthellaceae bacterium]
MATQDMPIKPIRKPCAADVAKYMLVKKGSLTGYQLEKLLYYCQAWSLAVNKKSLFDDEIRAFENGPVVPSVSYQHQGRMTVMPSHISGDINALSDSDISLIDAVLDAYDGLSGDDLVELSHSEDPWPTYWNHRTGRSSAAIIPIDAIQAYYSKLLAADDYVKAAHHVPVFDHPKNMYVSSADFDWLVDYLETEE